jgi:very-short-patch-repair endonuclease
MRHFLATSRSEPDVVVARVATRQHGIVSIRQLYTAGLTKDAVKRRVSAGRLHRVYHGVYAVGHIAISNEGGWMAAVLASGSHAALSHRSAAELWGMLGPGPGPVHVTIRSAGGRRPGRDISLHRSPSLPKAATTVRNGISVTTPARTIQDLHRTASVDDVRRAVREAQFRRLDIGSAAGVDGELTRSRLERRFLRLCRRHRLPQPEVNTYVGRFEVDFVWRDRRLVVETDGWQAHGTRSSFEADRARDVELRLLGFEVLRFTYRQVTDRPEAVAAKLQALL